MRARPPSGVALWATLALASPAGPAGPSEGAADEPSIRAALLANGAFDEPAMERSPGVPPDRVPWWRTRGPVAIEREGDRVWLAIGPGGGASQPVPGYAPSLGGLSLSGVVRGAGVLRIEDGRGAVAVVRFEGADDEPRPFEIDGAELARTAGVGEGDLVPRLEVELSAAPDSAGAAWAELELTVPLPAPGEASLRAEVLARLDEVVSLWLEHSLDRTGPRETGYVGSFFDVVSGERLSAVSGGAFPLWNFLVDALVVHEEPRWREALEAFLESYLELGFDPGTGLPRKWDVERDRPLGEWVEIASDLELLLDVAERGPEPWRERAFAAALAIAETVLERGVLPDGSIAPKYHPVTAETSTATTPLRRLDVAAQLARIGALTGDERFVGAARNALSEFEFTHHWPGSWDRIDPGFDDMFGIYGARALTMLESHPNEPAFAAVVRSGFEHYAPLWRDATRFGGTIAADQVRCWELLVDWAELEPSIRPELAPLVAAAARAHWQGEQYPGGAFGDVTFVHFDPKTGIQVGDLPGTPANLLHGLALAYDERLGLRTDEVRALYTAVLRSTVSHYRRPYGYLLTQREQAGVNHCGGGLRMMPGLIEMLARLSE